MINLSLYLSLALTVGAITETNAPDTVKTDVMPGISRMLQNNFPELTPAGNDAVSSPFKRMKRNEAEKNTVSRIPDVKPGFKVAPVDYACRLDSVVKVDHTGAFYDKDIFQFTEEGLPKHRLTQKWDKTNNQWYDKQDYTYEYDKDGYLTKFLSVEKTTGRGSTLSSYEYDELHNLKVETLYKYNNGETTPYRKAQYSFDQWNQCVESHEYSYNTATGEWDNISWVRGELLPDGKQKWVEEYTWTGTKWKGIQRKNYDYDDKGRTTLFGESLWMNDSDEWLYNLKFVRHYRDDGQISLDETLNWNRERNDWSGLDDYGFGRKRYNTRVIYTYDDRNRIISEKQYTQQDNGEMLPGALVQYEWSDRGNGVTRKRKIRSIYDETGENLQDESLDEIMDLNPQGSAIFLSSSRTYDGWKTANTIYEQTLTYEADGTSIRDGEHYNWDVNGNKMPYVKEHYEYDSDMNCLLSDYWQGQDTPDWHPYSHFMYEYENGERTRKYAYFYGGGTEPKPNWGEGWDWDFTIPYEKVLTWPTQEGLKIKVDAIYSFFADGGDWGYQVLKYYYSPMKSTSVERAELNGTLRLENRTLTASAADAAISVYDTTGRHVAEGIGSVSLFNLQPGIYMAVSCGEVLKFILK